MNMKHFLAKAFPVFLFLAIVALLHCPFSFAYEEEIKDISANMAKDIADAGKKTIAVADFTDLQGNVTELGRFLAEEFSVLPLQAQAHDLRLWTEFISRA